jgi:NADH-quinone oxidoreductase subunit I
MNEYWNDIIGGARSLVVGLSITAKEFFKPVITEQYPHEVPVMKPRFRGHIELVGGEDGKSLCVACGMCQKACPSDCITVTGKKEEGSKKKSVDKYILDFTKCSLCGTCVESCTFGAIQFSKDYNLASTRKEDYIFDLLKRLEGKS